MSAGVLGRVQDARTFGRYLLGLRPFLRERVTVDVARRRIRAQLDDRPGAFLSVLERAVYGQPASPYGALLRHADVELGDVRRLVADRGVEGALGALLDAGVRVSLDEFKGRRPIVRPGLEVPTTAQSFDNPLLARHFQARTGGSRGVRRRLIIDLDLLSHEAGYHVLFYDAFDLADRPFALWRAAPPAASGMKNALYQAKVGRRVGAWFTPSRLGEGPAGAASAAMTLATVAASRAWAAHPIPRPRHTPLAEAATVARWLADRRAEGAPAVLDTNVSAAIRVLRAAGEAGLDVRGTFFRLGGEPYTEAREAIFGEAGCQATCHYSLSEIGRLGVACRSPEAVDEVHVMTDKVAVLQRPREVGGTTVGALLLTTILPSVPKLLLNVEIDDYGNLSERDCGCPLGDLGLGLHLDGIRSYEKLTSEGIQFLGSDLIALVDEVLPARFGGAPTDYQIVEEEEGGLPRVAVVASPDVGPLDEGDVVATVLAFLSGHRDGGTRLGSEVWRDGRTLRLVRRTPHATATNKVLALHVAGSGAEPPAG